MMTTTASSKGGGSTGNNVANGDSNCNFTNLSQKQQSTSNRISIVSELVSATVQ